MTKLSLRNLCVMGIIFTGVLWGLLRPLQDSKSSKLDAIYAGNDRVLDDLFPWDGLIDSPNLLTSTVAFSPQITIAGGQAIVASPLITVAIEPGDFVPVAMAFSQNGSSFSPWEPFQSTRVWPMDDPEIAYQLFLLGLNDGESFCDWDNEFGVLAWGESYILDSLLDMYEVTGNTTYLEEFIEHADAVIAQGDDNTNRPDYRGFVVRPQSRTTQDMCTITECRGYHQRPLV